MAITDLRHNNVVLFQTCSAPRAPLIHPTRLVPTRNRHADFFWIFCHTTANYNAISHRIRVRIWAFLIDTLSINAYAKSVEIWNSCERFFYANYECDAKASRSDFAVTYINIAARDKTVNTMLVKRTTSLYRLCENFAVVNQSGICNADDIRSILWIENIDSYGEYWILRVWNDLVCTWIPRVLSSFVITDSIFSDRCVERIFLLLIYIFLVVNDVCLSDAVILSDK